MQTYLETLTTVALLGTEKRTMPDPIAGMEMLVVEGAPEETLLTQLAAADLYVRSGQQTFANTRLQPEPAPPEEKAAISSEAVHYLRQMFSGQQKQFLPEFLDAVHRSGKRIPNGELPRLLETGQRDSAFRERIEAVLTARGQWLARQNPDWAYAIKPTALLESFETGELVERAAALRALRQDDADGARDLLAEGWSKEVAKARTELIGALMVNLSAADESFLEAALDDKSKSVRAVAADLLARLPESAYTQRMIERAVPLIQFEHGGLLALRRSKLRVTLPEALDESATRDGLSEKNPPRGMGIKAWCFKQIVSRVPLSVWTANADLHTLLKACPKEDRDLLVESWISACRQFPDAAHAAELLEYALVINTIQQLAQALSDEQLALLAAKLLNQESQLVTGHPLLYLLDQTEFDWPQRLQKQFIHSLSNSMKKWKRNYDGKLVLDKLVRTLPLELLPLCVQAAPQEAEHPIFPAFVEFNRLAEFRQKMIAAVYDL